jgi:hypothetical protein
MEIEFTLKRAYKGEKYTIGHFGLTGQPAMCDTLEDRVRDYNADGDLNDPGEQKIAGETAIPYDRYPVTVVDSPHFKRRVPLLHNVRHFTAIEMHSGTTALDSRGCILPGENREKGKVLNSRYWEAKITKMIDDFIADGHHVFINIIP